MTNQWRPGGTVGIKKLPVASVNVAPLGVAWHGSQYAPDGIWAGRSDDIDRRACYRNGIVSTNRARIQRWRPYPATHATGWAAWARIGSAAIGIVISALRRPTTKRNKRAS